MSWGVRMQYKTIGEICTVVSGTTPKSDKAEYWGGNLIWITPAELKEGNAVIYDSVRHITKAAVKASALKPFPKGTVILSSRAPIGKVAIAGTKMYCNQGFKNLICSEAIYNGYLYYYLKAKTAYLNSLGRGATFREISKQIVEEIKIPVPSMQEQHRIADILFKIDALMGKRQQQAEKLDELVKARFVEMFGDPVRNTKLFPQHELKEYIQFLTSGSRGWAKFFSDDGELFITIKNVKNGHINLSDVQHVMPPDNAEAKRTKVQAGDLLISITADLGRTGVVSDNLAQRGAYINQHLTCIRLKKDEVLPQYVSAFLESAAGKRQFSAKNQSAVKAGLNFEAIKSLRLFMPPLELQREYIVFVNEVDREKEHIQRSAALLETLKRSLMQQYFG